MECKGHPKILVVNRGRLGVRVIPREAWKVTRDMLDLPPNWCKQTAMGNIEHWHGSPELKLDSYNAGDSFGVAKVWPMAQAKPCEDDYMCLYCLIADREDCDLQMLVDVISESNEECKPDMIKQKKWLREKMQDLYDNKFGGDASWIRPAKRR